MQPESLPDHSLLSSPEAGLQHLLINFADPGHRRLLDEHVLWAILRPHQRDQLLRMRPRFLACDHDRGDGVFSDVSYDLGQPPNHLKVTRVGKRGSIETAA